MKLTAKKVEKLKQPRRYADGAGLYLQISETGVKSWILRYQRQGRERLMGLGPLRDFTLKEARERARNARQLLADGIDPLDARKAARAATILASAKNITFKEAAQQFFDQHGQKWRNKKHRAQFLSSLEAYAFKMIGDLPIAVIDTTLVLKVLEQKLDDYGNKTLWTAIPETASRLRNRIQNVIDWAVVRGYRAGDNPARWKGHLDNVLPARGKIQKVRHHPALAYADIPKFMSDLRKREGVPARALEFLILTAARTGAVIGGLRSEIDFKQKVWSVPPERAETKITSDEPRRIPLCDRAIEILKSLPAEEGNPHLFIGGKAGSGLSNMAMAELLKDMAWPSTTPGRLATVHGFRSSFRDWSAELTTHPNHVAEAALWHAVADKIEAAYRRGDMLDKRRALMNDWARYCARAPAKAADVVSIRGRR